MFHQADLRFLFHRLMRRPVLADPECVMGPDELHRQPHQRRETHRRLHIVAKGKERRARSPDASVQRHAVAEAGHGQLADASLQERAAEVAFSELLGLLQEAVRLVTVGQVGRGHNQVFHLPGQPTQHVARGGAGGAVWLVGDLLEVQGRQLPREEQIELPGQLRIGFGPLLLLGLARGGGFSLLRFGFPVKLGHLREDDERRRRVAAQVGNGLLEGGARLA